MKKKLHINKRCNTACCIARFRCAVFCIFSMNMRTLQIQMRKSLRMQLSSYVCSYISYFACVCVPDSNALVKQRKAVASYKVEKTTGNVSSFACNQLGLLSLQNIACFRCEVFRCCLLLLQNIAFATKYSMNQTFTAGSTKRLLHVVIHQTFTAGSTN